MRKFKYMYVLKIILFASMFIDAEIINASLIDLEKKEYRIKNEIINVSKTVC